MSALVSPLLAAMLQFHAPFLNCVSLCCTLFLWISQPLPSPISPCLNFPDVCSNRLCVLRLRFSTYPFLCYWKGVATTSDYPFPNANNNNNKAHYSTNDVDIAWVVCFTERRCSSEDSKGSNIHRRRRRYLLWWGRPRRHDLLTIYVNWQRGGGGKAEKGKTTFNWTSGLHFKTRRKITKNFPFCVDWKRKQPYNK